jgi:aminoglycoside phosphotransferase (APT) family kinase protein
VNRPLADVSALVGGEVTAVTPLRWGFEHHTDLVALADGRRVVVKRFEGADGRAELLRAATFASRLEAAGIPTPAVLAAQPDRYPPILVLAHVEGTTGAEWLDSSTRAQTLARTMGELAVRLRGVPLVAGDHDEGPWANGARLAEAAAGWLERLRPDIDRGTDARATRDTIERLARAIGGIGGLDAATSPCLAHGDFVPVNVLLGPGGSLAGVLDLGAWRVAHPWLDVAWWGWVVRTFHPDAWTAAWSTMLSAAGIPSDPASAGRLHTLEVVRCLEWAATREDPAAVRLLAATVARQVEP